MSDTQATVGPPEGECSVTCKLSIGFLGLGTKASKLAHAF
jgi:hypothetical protein